MIILYIGHDTIGFYLALNLHDILFLFIAAPGSPGNAHVLDIDEDSVTLAWSKPVHDGGKKIQGYCVEYKDPTSGRWKLHNDIPTPDCKYTGKWLKRPVDVLFSVHDMFME